MLVTKSISHRSSSHHTTRHASQNKKCSPHEHRTSIRPTAQVMPCERSLSSLSSLVVTSCPCFHAHPQAICNHPCTTAYSSHMQRTPFSHAHTCTTLCFTLISTLIMRGATTKPRCPHQGGGRLECKPTDAHDTLQNVPCASSYAQRSGVALATARTRTAQRSLQAGRRRSAPPSSQAGPRLGASSSQAGRGR